VGLIRRVRRQRAHCGALTRVCEDLRAAVRSQKRAAPSRSARSPRRKAPGDVHASSVGPTSLLAPCESRSPGCAGQVGSVRSKKVGAGAACCGARRPNRLRHARGAIVPGRRRSRHPMDGVRAPPHRPRRVQTSLRSTPMSARHRRPGSSPASEPCSALTRGAKRQSSQRLLARGSSMPARRFRTARSGGAT
jgi:hypothetical protein